MSASPTLTAVGTAYDPRRARMLLAIFAGMALTVTYVETMVLPAFKQFYTFFGLTGTASFGTVAWILSAYLLVGTVVVPIFGKLGDLYGKKRMLVIAMSVYAVAVAIAGFTPNLGDLLGVARDNQIYLLIGARAVQGVGMGMFPLAFAMIPEAFPAAEVGKAQGIISAMFASGAAIGLVAGGWIAQNFGWQLTYHTVIPAAVLLVLLAAILLEESRRHAQPSMDLPGITSLAAGLAFLLFAITEGPYWGWSGFASVHLGLLPWGTPELFLLSGAAFVFFGAWEPRARSPVIRFASLKPRNIWVANVNGLVVGALMFFSFTASVILAELPTTFGGLGLSEFQFGLLALPAAIAMLAGGAALGAGASRFGPKPITLLGYALAALGGFGLLAFHRTPFELSAFLVPILVGAVALFIACSNIIVLSVDRRELGIQTGMNQTFRNVGSALAPVVTTSLLASFTATYLVSVPTATGSVLVAESAYSITGFEAVFGLMAALAIVGFLVSLGIRNFRFRADGTQDGRGETPAASTSASVGGVESPAPSP